MDNAEPVQDLDVAPEPVLLKLLRWADPRQTNNIAEEILPTVLSSIGARVVEEYNLDNNSRDKWYKEAKTALDLALQRAKPKTHPWDGASNVILPIITEAADQFAARAIPPSSTTATSSKARFMATITAGRALTPRRGNR